MKISMQMPYAGGFEQSVEQTVALEQAGLDIIYVAEAYSFDAVSAMGYLAARTSTVQIASGILPIYTRTPTLLAMTAAGLDAISGGRAILGLGASGPQVIEGFHGVPYQAPLGRTREIIDICRKVWAREDKLTHDGRYYHAAAARRPGHRPGQAAQDHQPPAAPRDPDPHRLARAEEHRAHRRVGRGLAPALLHAIEGQRGLRAGARRRVRRSATRSSAPMDVVAGGLVAIGDDVKAVLDLARPMVALYVGGMGSKGKNFYNALVRRYGFEAEAEEIQDLYLAGNKQEAEAAVPLELLEAINLVGPEGYVRERIAEFAEAGVSVLNVAPIASPADQPKVVEQLKTWRQ